jgi:amidase
MQLDRIDQVNGPVNAIVELQRESALLAATAADELIAHGGDIPPLHGVPITIKDAFDVAGMHTTWGNPAFKDFMPPVDATLVRRLRQAGAIIIGKTNVAFMLADYGQTGNELYGVTSNPWDPARTPGGSSGGAAAAVSAGMSFLDFGSDLVGSIRIPAGHCGVYGLKPSVGTVPLTGLQPPGVPPERSEMLYMSAAGPFSRSADDLRIALAATGGPDGEAAGPYSWALPPSRHSRLTDFRVGVVFDHELAPVSSEVGAQLSKTVEALSAAGVRVRPGWPDGINPAREYESFGFHVGLFFAYGELDGEYAPLSTVFGHERRRMAARDAWERYFHDVDVFLCPANFTPAPPHDTRPFDQRTIITPEGERRYDNQPFWISHASLPGLPAVVAPIGRTPGGLPVGVQVVGPMFEDNTAITFAELLTGLVGGYESPPLSEGEEGVPVVKEAKHDVR